MNEADPKPRQQPAALHRPTFVTVFILAITQIIGWGTTYFVPSVLVRSFQRDLELAPEFVFAGITVMLIVSAIVSPRVGKFIDRVGAKAVLSAGSIVAAIALVALANAQGGLSYGFAWALIGLAMPMALMMAAFAQVAQISGDGARRAISGLTLFTGFTSTMFWPLTAWLDAEIGWRATLLLYAGLHIFVCLPLHVFALPRREMSSSGDTVAAVPKFAPLPPALHRRALWLVAIAFTSMGSIGWGLSLLVPELLKLFGYSAAIALTIASLTGPFQVFARFGDWLTASRVSAVDTAVIAAAMMPVALLAMLFAGQLVAVALLFVMLWGMCNGLSTVTRAAVPLELFGLERYGALVGKLALPQNLVFSASPIVFTALLERTGPNLTLSVALVLSLVSLSAMVMLSRLVRRAQSASHGTGSPGDGR